MSIGPPISEIQHFQNLTLKIQGQGHSSRSQSRYNTVSTHIPFICMSIGPPIPGIQLFQNLTLKIQVKGHGRGQTWKHNIGPTFSRLTSFLFHVNWASHSWVTTFFQNLTLKIKGQGSGWSHSSKPQSGSNILLTHIPLVPCQSAPKFLRYSIFKFWTWKSRIKVKWPWCCTTTGLHNSIELLMV